MSVSPAVLLVSIAVGVPLMLIALGVLYHAYLFGRQPVDALDEHVDSLATESAEELLFTLQEAVDQMQTQLAHQRDTLASMFSDRSLAGRDLRPALALDRPMAAGEFVQQMATPDAPMDIRDRIANLAEDGMSDRAIARELRIGLEEVRIARMRGQS